MNEQDLALNNLQGLICPKTQPTIQRLVLFLTTPISQYTSAILTPGIRPFY